MNTIAGMTKDDMRDEIKRLRKLVRKQGLEIVECDEVITLLKAEVRKRLGGIVLTDICKSAGIKHLEHEEKQAYSNPTTAGEDKFIEALSSAPKTLNSLSFFMSR